MTAILAKLLSPMGRVIAGFLAVAAVLIGTYSAGWMAHARASKVDQLRADLAAAQRDLQAAKDAAELAESISNRAQAESTEARKKAEEYAQSLQKRPSCDLTDDDIKRLRGIRKK
jgi:hypothetical protein